MRYIFTLRFILFVILFSLAPYLLNLVLEQDEKFGLFDWLESPNDSPFFGLFGIACGVLIWLITRRPVAGRPAKDKPFGTTVFWGVNITWLINWMFLGLLLFEHPPAPVSATYKVEVIDLITPPRQSKPIKHNLIVHSWRGNSQETLQTISYFNAEKLFVAGSVEVSIGKDWLGRIRVLQVKPVSIDE